MEEVLLGIEDEKLQYEIAQKVIDDKIICKRIRKVIRNLINQKMINKKKKQWEDLSPYYKDITNKLQNYFGTKVNIN